MISYLTLIKEKGITWFVNRTLYSFKLKLLQKNQWVERIFERKTAPVKQLDLFSFDIQKLQDFLRNLPDQEKENIIHRANSACEGKIYGFSSLDLDYGYPINWQLNPLTGKQSDKNIKWYNIPDFDKERGDIKVIWEASRFTHLFVIARAFLLTGEMKYVDSYFHQIKDWAKQNTYAYGANYKCGQECSFRMISCLFTYNIFKHYASDEDINAIEYIVESSYKKILSNFFYAYRCIKNNHTISELVGMAIGAWCCDEFNRLQYAIHTLDKVIAEQFSDDGGYIQQSFNYQRLALDDVSIILGLEDKFGMKLNGVSKAKVLKSILLMYQCQDESGDMPNYGSNDGALILPITECGYRDFSPTINTAYALLKRKRLYKNGLHDEALIWFDLHVDECELIERESCQFPQAGIYTFRRTDSWMMIVCKDETHHMDQNHIDLWVDGENVLCDAGSYSYADKVGKTLSSSIGHNTAYCVDKQQINRISGAFAVYGQPKICRCLWTPSLFESEIEFSTGYRHKRHVEMTDYGFFISDEVDDSQITILFHTPCKICCNQQQYDLGKCEIRFSEVPYIDTSIRSLYYLQTSETSCMSIRGNNGKSSANIIIKKGETTND